MRNLNFLSLDIIFYLKMNQRFLFVAIWHCKKKKLKNYIFFCTSTYHNYFFSLIKLIFIIIIFAYSYNLVINCGGWKMLCIYLYSVV